MTFSFTLDTLAQKSSSSPKHTDLINWKSKGRYLLELPCFSGSMESSFTQNMRAQTEIGVCTKPENMNQSCTRDVHARVQLLFKKPALLQILNKITYSILFHKFISHQSLCFNLQFSYPPFSHRDCFELNSYFLYK